MITALLAGAGVALALSVPPGPVLVETIRRGLRGGFPPALMVQLGSILGDLAWCAAALFGLAPLVALPWARISLGALGVALLLWLGIKGVRDAVKGPPSSLTPSPASESMATASAKSLPVNDAAFRSGLAISLTNPWAVGFWASLGGALIAAGVAGNSPAQTAAFVGGYALGVTAYAFVVAGCFRWLQRYLQPGGQAARIVIGACGLCLMALGLVLGWQVFA